MKYDLYKLRYYASMLEHGIDPTSNIKFENDTILNLDEIKQYNGFVREILDKLIYVEKRTKKSNDKIPFFLVDEQKKEIELSEQAISISELCYRINAVVPHGMNKLRPGLLANCLESKGYLESVVWRDDKTIKMPTGIGEKLGIKKHKKTNSYGNEYSVNLYSKRAQEYIIENVEKLIYE